MPSGSAASVSRICVRGEHRAGQQALLGPPVPAEQKIMNDAAAETRAYQRQVSRAAAQKAVGELQGKGMQFNEVAPAEQARMREISRPVTEKFAASYDPATVHLYNTELARVRK
jgi:TRAP-type C4-dicarboxylate transport system substrate-binding protein